MTGAVPRKTLSKAAHAKSAPGGRRAAARLGAVQALYQLEMNGGTALSVADEFVRHRLGREMDGDVYGGADEALFRRLFLGAAGRRDELDNIIAAVLPDTWPLDRIDTILRQILRCGVCELAEFADVPAPVVISEYVGVADAFFAGKEPGMVNAVLDRLARDLRPPEVRKGEARGGEPAKD